MSTGKLVSNDTDVAKVEKELILQSLIESFQLENICISEDRARAILKRVELKESK